MLVRRPGLACLILLEQFLPWINTAKGAYKDLFVIIVTNILFMKHDGGIFEIN